MRITSLPQGHMLMPVKPPSTYISAPVIKLPATGAQSRIAAPRSSSGVPKRFIGVLPMIESTRSGERIFLFCSADKPLSRVFIYSASKAAVLNYTKNVARELAPKGVRVNVLCPGFFPAEQNKKILSPERVASIMGKTPMNRFGTPDELLGAAILLCAPVAGSFITGAEIYVDGGFTGMSI